MGILNTMTMLHVKTSIIAVILYHSIHVSASSGRVKSILAAFSTPRRSRVAPFIGGTGHKAKTLGFDLLHVMSKKLGANYVPDLYEPVLKKMHKHYLPSNVTGASKKTKKQKIEQRLFKTWKKLVDAMKNNARHDEKVHPYKHNEDPNKKGQRRLGHRWNHEELIESMVEWLLKKIRECNFCKKKAHCVNRIVVPGEICASQRSWICVLYTFFHEYKIVTKYILPDLPWPTEEEIRLVQGSKRGNPSRPRLETARLHYGVLALIKKYRGKPFPLVGTRFITDLVRIP